MNREMLGFYWSLGRDIVEMHIMDRWGEEVIRLQIEDKEKFIDLMFYNLKLSCYVVIEVKVGEFDFQDAGQLGGYIVACFNL